MIYALTGRPNGHAFQITPLFNCRTNYDKLNAHQLLSVVHTQTHKHTQENQSQQILENRIKQTDKADYYNLFKRMFKIHFKSYGSFSQYLLLLRTN